jgi:hypothetical protein
MPHALDHRRVLADRVGVGGQRAESVIGDDQRTLIPGVDNR